MPLKVDFSVFRAHFICLLIPFSFNCLRRYAQHTQLIVWKCLLLSVRSYLSQSNDRFLLMESTRANKKKRINQAMFIVIHIFRCKVKAWKHHYSRNVHLACLRRVIFGLIGSIRCNRQTLNENGLLSQGTLLIFLLF
jgi:hypothetical protein